MSEKLYDVIVVGAGPAGSYTAYELASRGYDVLVFEEKSAPGVNACCTGIVSAECLEMLDPGQDVILTGASSASLFSPSGKRLRLETGDVRAYVVDRPLLDRTLAARAQSQGAQYSFSSQVVDVIAGRDKVHVESLCTGVRRTFSARAVVLASGFKQALARRLGLNGVRDFLVGAQAEVEAGDIEEIEVHFGQDMMKGSFGWLVPAGGNKAYAGLLSTARAGLQLRGLLGDLFRGGRIASRDVEIRQKPIPIGCAGRSYAERVVVVGDAAGQVKATTGGGIYFGHLGARIAADVLDGALRDDDLGASRLSDYQKRWKARMGRELSSGYRARRLWNRLGDRQIETLFSVLSNSGLTDALLKSDGLSFDWHSGALLTVLRHASVYPWLKVKRLFAEEVGS